MYYFVKSTFTWWKPQAIRSYLFKMPSPMPVGGLATASLVLTAAVVGNAYYQKKQFYPSVVYITKSNPSMAVSINNDIKSLFTLWVYSVIILPTEWNFRIGILSFLKFESEFDTNILNLKANS